MTKDARLISPPEQVLNQIIEAQVEELLERTL